MKYEQYLMGFYVTSALVIPLYMYLSQIIPSDKYVEENFGIDINSLEVVNMRYQYILTKNDLNLLSLR